MAQKKKLQVFVSSTYQDLREERQMAVEAILMAGHIPAGMELFAAGDESQLQTLEHWIDDSDVFMLILGGRYGSIEPKSHKSYIQLEYEYALQKEKPLFAVVIDSNYLEKKVRKFGSSVVERDHLDKLVKFRELVLQKMVSFWSDSRDLRNAIINALIQFDQLPELKGWTRGNEIINSSALREELARLEKENASLRAQHGNPEIIEELRAFKSLLESMKAELASYYPNKTKILFLTADPSNASRLRLGEEAREIEEKLLMIARFRDNFSLYQRWSTRPQDITQAFLDLSPNIVHFSGHGTETGALCFENNSGEVHPVEADALAALFELFSGKIECVLLNACYSEVQARAISQYVPDVIGMSQAIGDKAAISFAQGFYQALGAGEKIDRAYKLGCVQIRLHGIPEHLYPVLIKNPQLLIKKDDGTILL